MSAILPFHNHGAASVETKRGEISHFQVDNYNSEHKLYVPSMDIL